MNKPMFLTGAGFLGVESIMFLSYLLYNSQQAQQITVLALFAILNIGAIIMMAVGSQQDSY